MTALLITGMILFLLTLLLCCSATLYVELKDQELTVRAGAFGLRFRIWSTADAEKDPSSEKLKKKSEKKRKSKTANLNHKKGQKTKENRTSEEISAERTEAQTKAEHQKDLSAQLEQLPEEKRNLFEVISLVLDFIKAALGPAGFLIYRVRITSFCLTMSVGGEDASKAALNYAAVGSAVPYFIAGLGSVMTVKVRRADIWADFVTGETHQQLFFKVKLRFFELLYAGLCMIRNYLVNTNQKDSSASREKRNRNASVSHSGMRTEK